MENTDFTMDDLFSQDNLDDIFSIPDDAPEVTSVTPSREGYSNPPKSTSTGRKNTSQKVKPRKSGFEVMTDTIVKILTVICTPFVFVFELLSAILAPIFGFVIIALVVLFLIQLITGFPVFVFIFSLF